MARPDKKNICFRNFDPNSTVCCRVAPPPTTTSVASFMASTPFHSTIAPSHLNLVGNSSGYQASVSGIGSLRSNSYYNTVYPVNGIISNVTNGPAHGYGPSPAHGYGPSPAHIYGHNPSPAHSYGHNPSPASGYSHSPAHSYGYNGYTPSTFGDLNCGSDSNSKWARFGSSDSDSMSAASFDSQTRWTVGEYGEPSEVEFYPSNSSCNTTTSSLSSNSSSSNNSRRSSSIPSDDVYECDDVPDRPSAERSRYFDQHSRATFRPERAD